MKEEVSISVVEVVEYCMWLGVSCLSPILSTSIDKTIFANNSMKIQLSYENINMNSAFGVVAV